MKRIAGMVILISLFICCLFPGAVADDSEIVFCKIPWLSDEDTVIRFLKDNQMLRSDYSISEISNNNSTYLIENENGFVQPIIDKDYNDVCLSLSLLGYVKGKVAGYPIKNIIPVFAYDGSYKLIAFRIGLIGTTYSDLKEKIAKVYGQSEEKINEVGMLSICWKGSNDSCIVLFNENADESYDLIYGRLDATDILEKCLVPSDTEDVIGL